ncbi:uncharacterized protein Fot_52857 [Forsythia ovata]|uniref:EF-hand domain-containing protein n=1 Tax=Forsythia ovata TaxID=205694 RepID=A0ABD1PH08_9LAMI
MRKIARAYYDRASKEEKYSAREFFESLDQDGDGKVSLWEFKESVSSWFSNDKVFKQLDTNGDGTLNFYEVLAIYYMKKIRICRCNCCRDLLVGPYFSCFLCLGKVPKTFDLCCNCYREGKFQHEHSSSNFLDHHSLLMMFRDRLTEEQETHRKSFNYPANPSCLREMDEMIEVAKSHFERASEKDKYELRKLFRAVDADKDGKVSFMEFYEFCTQRVSNSEYEFEPEFLDRDIKFFEQFASNNNGTLDFNHLVAMCYANEVGIPFCDLCGKLLPGLHFSCLRCQKEGDDLFSLCCACYCGGEFDHHHTSADFVDSLSMLKLLRESKNPKNDEEKSDKEEEKFGTPKGYESTTTFGVSSATSTPYEMLMTSLESILRNLENIRGEASTKGLVNMFITAILLTRLAPSVLSPMPAVVTKVQQ